MNSTTHTYYSGEVLEALRSAWNEFGNLQGREAIDLSMINPDLTPPRFLLDKLVEATLKPHNHRYAVARGIRKLREAFSYKYQTSFGVNLNPEKNVCVTFGTKDALHQLFQILSLFPQSGNRKILLGAPSYPAHISAASLAGFTPVLFELSENQNLMLERIEKALEQEAVQILLLNFPNNPTGQIVDKDFYRQLAQLVSKYNVIVINDFVYGELGFDGVRPCSLLSEIDFGTSRIIESFSLSKAYSIPGWRVGALLGNAELVHLVAARKSLADYGLFLPMQQAASAALTSKDDVVSSIRQTYQQRAKHFVKGLLQVGFAQIHTPQAGASVWAKIPDSFTAENQNESRSLSFVSALLKDSGILSMPGVLFGKEFDNYVRFALVHPTEKLQVVLERIGSFLGSQVKPAKKVSTVPELMVDHA